MNIITDYQITECGSFEDFLQQANRYDWLIHHYKSGSRVICNPPPLDTDEDHLVLVKNIDRAGLFFSYNKWSNCLEDWEDKKDRDPGEQEDDYVVELTCGARFQAWRRGEVNVIMTDDETLHVRSVAATLLAKEVNLMEKDQRIKLFRCIKFGETYGGRLP